MFKTCLFLDVDGVANSVKDKDPDFMNPENLRILNELQEEIGFEAVLSSTWRLFFRIAEFNHKFKGWGSKFEVIDYTCRPYQLPDRDMGDGYLGYGGMSKRGHEIQTWLDEEELVPGKNCAICILDDMGVEHFPGLSKYLVQTSMKTGLEEKHKKYVREVFAKQLK